MEAPLKQWRRRCEERWIAGADPDALVTMYSAFRDERARHSGSLRVQLADTSPLAQLTAAFAALHDLEDPLDAFLTPGHATSVELAAFESAIAADFFWSSHEFVSCGRPRVGRTSGACSRLFIPTGGTSSAPRFAAHTCATLEAAARSLQAWLGGGPVDSVCMLPLHHVSGFMQAMRSYVSGGTLTIWEWSRAAAGHFPAPPAPPGVTSLVPTQLARLLEVPGGAAWLRSFRCVFLGGAAGWPDLLERARAHDIPLAPCYGMTESAAQVTALPPADFLAGATGVGAPLPHARIGIVDTSGQPVPAGSEGRIRIMASSLFCGYFPDPAPSPLEVFDTSDRGCLDRDGRLTVLGRLDAVINTGGEKVDPLEVEAAIRALGAADVAVLGVPDTRWGEAVVALIVDCPLDDADLHLRLRQGLAAPKVPKRFIRVAALPRSLAGKLDRRSLEPLLLPA